MTAAALEGPGPDTPGFAARAGRMASAPFVHFTLLGALLFAAHHLFTPDAKPPTIEVSALEQRHLLALFEQRQHRAPTEAERQQLIQRHVEDEALFREGLRLSLVHSDPILRAQMIARVRGMLQAELDQNPPSEAELEGYYGTHRSDYANPETISYREYWIPGGPDATAVARRLIERLRHDGGGDQELPIPLDYSSYSKTRLVRRYGTELADALWTLPSGSWHPLRSSRGVHLVRVERRTAAEELPLSTIRERVRADYRKERTARAFRAELGRLTSRWRVQVEPL